MATYLIDSSTFSRLMARHPRAVSRLREAATENRLVICTIVRGEVLYGLDRMPHGKRRRALEGMAAYLFDELPCEPVPESASDIYARIKRETERIGRPIGENDLWIASMAQLLGAIVVTCDTDFSRVAGLEVEDWTR